MENENQVVVVTGAGSGKGRESCVKLAQNGATVVVVDFNQSTGEERDAGAYR